MNAGLSRTLLWGACAAALLLGGFALFVAIAARLASGDAQSVEETRQGLMVYAVVVLAKGLVPQLVLTFVLYVLVARRANLESSRLRMALGVALCALVSGGVVAGALLPLGAPSVPVVVFPDAGNFLATVVEMSAAIITATLLPRWLVPSLRWTPLAS
jgi:hypothetical protein